MSLPLALGTTLATIPARCLPGRRSARRGLAGYGSPPAAGRRVGLVWAGNAGQAKRPRSGSIALDGPPRSAAAGVASCPLQKASAAAEARPAGRCTIIDGRRSRLRRHRGASPTSISSSPSTPSVAHLAGGMGKPVWVLLPFHACWRWLLDREDSPWYPTARLFRQRRPGDWDGVLARVGAALRDHAGGRVGPARPPPPSPLPRGRGRTETKQSPKPLPLPAIVACRSPPLFAGNVYRGLIAVSAVIAYMTGGREVMATLTIRNVDTAVKERLRIRAARHGQSMEAELRSIVTRLSRWTRSAQLPISPKRSGGASRHWAASTWSPIRRCRSATRPASIGDRPRHQRHSRTDAPGAAHRRAGVGGGSAAHRSTQRPSTRRKSFMASPLCRKRVAAAASLPQPPRLFSQRSSPDAYCRSGPPPRFAIPGLCSRGGWPARRSRDLCGDRGHCTGGRRERRHARHRRVFRLRPRAGRSLDGQMK